MPIRPVRSLPGPTSLVIGVSEYQDVLLPVLDAAMIFGRRSLVDRNWQMILLKNGQFRALMLAREILAEKSLPREFQKNVPLSLRENLVYGCYPETGGVRLILNMAIMGTSFDKLLVSEFIPTMTSTMLDAPARLVPELLPETAPPDSGPESSTQTPLPASDLPPPAAVRADEPALTAGMSLAEELEDHLQFEPEASAAPSPPTIEAMISEWLSDDEIALADELAANATSSKNEDKTLVAADAGPEPEPEPVTKPEPVMEPEAESEPEAVAEAEVEPEAEAEAEVEVEAEPGAESEMEEETGSAPDSEDTSETIITLESISTVEDLEDSVLPATDPSSPEEENLDATLAEELAQAQLELAQQVAEDEKRRQQEAEKSADSLLPQQDPLEQSQPGENSQHPTPEKATDLDRELAAQKKLLHETEKMLATTRQSASETKTELARQLAEKEQLVAQEREEKEKSLAKAMASAAESLAREREKNLALLKEKTKYQIMALKLAAKGKELEEKLQGKTGEDRSLPFVKIAAEEEPQATISTTEEQIDCSPLSGPNPIDIPIQTPPGQENPTASESIEEGLPPLVSGRRHLLRIFMALALMLLVDWWLYYDLLHDRIPNETVSMSSSDERQTEILPETSKMIAPDRQPSLPESSGETTLEPPPPAEPARRAPTPPPLVIIVPQDAPMKSGSYKIKEGDTLWAITRKITGNPYEYPRVARENKIADPDLIYPEQQIVLKRRGEE